MGLIKKLFKGQKADHELRKPAPMGTPQQPRGVPALQALDKLHEVASTRTMKFIASLPLFRI